jgi:L-iditol 2-dehydrogenase
MRAAVLSAARQLTVEDVAAPLAGAGDVIVRVMANTLCGSDLHAFQGVHPRVGVGGWFGHEISGVVAAVGPAVTRVAVGQRVAVDSVLPCDRCDQCLAGHTNRCRNYLTTGSRGDGGLAELVRVPEQNAYAIPDSLSFEAAALVQPLAISHHAVTEIARVRSGDVVCVVGGGPVGLFVLLLCRRLGATVVVSDPRSARATMARALGASGVAGAGPEAVSGVLEELGQARGSDHTFDCVGGAAGISVLETCVEVTRPGGAITILGTYDGDVLAVPYPRLAGKELLLRSSRSYTRPSYAACLRMAADGELVIPDLVTHRFSLDQAQQALVMLDEGDPAVVKAAVLPND